MAIRSMNDVIVISVDLKYSFFMWNYFWIITSAWL